MNKSHIVCAVDVNDYDQQLVELAATFARHFDAVLDLVHVTLFPDPANAAWPAYLGSPEAMISDNRRLREIAPNIEDLEVHHHHLSGTPAERILEFVAKHSPSLIVLGTHARRGLARIVGSVATSVMRSAECPVLVIRQQQNSQQFADVPNR